MYIYILVAVPRCTACKSSVCTGTWPHFLLTRQSTWRYQTRAVSDVTTPPTPPNHFVVRKLENTDGGGSAHPISVLSGFSSKLPLPFYADVRLYIPMTHHHGRP